MTPRTLTTYYALLCLALRFLLTPEEVFIGEIEVWDYDDYIDEYGELEYFASESDDQTVFYEDIYDPDNILDYSDYEDA